MAISTIRFAWVAPSGGPAFRAGLGQEPGPGPFQDVDDGLDAAGIDRLGLKAHHVRTDRKPRADAAGIGHVTQRRPGEALSCP